jgi:hypothetical protein
MASSEWRLLLLLPTLLWVGCAHGLHYGFTITHRDLGPCGTAPGRSSATAVVLPLSSAGDTLREATANARLTGGSSEATFGPFSPDPVGLLRIGPLKEGQYQLQVSAIGYLSVTTKLGFCGTGEVWYHAVLSKAPPAPHTPPP